MIKQGAYLKSKTKTKDDVFGDCIWKIVEDGLTPPEKNRRDEGDGVRCILVGGTGPAARIKRGLVIRDSVWKIKQDIENGISEVISPEEGARFDAHYSNTENDGKTAGGTIEVDF